MYPKKYITTEYTEYTEIQRNCEAKKNISPQRTANSNEIMRLIKTFHRTERGVRRDSIEIMRPIKTFHHREPEYVGFQMKL